MDSSRLPHLEVRGPDGVGFTYQLTGDRATVGRVREANDVALDPDPQRLVTRQTHCLVEREGGNWWLVDNGSVNGTFVSRDGDVKAVRGRALLADGDVIRVLARLLDDGGSAYWELLFVDPLQTRLAVAGAPRACLLYDRIGAQLYVVEGAHRRPVPLRPQEHKLVRHMAQRNAANDHVPVLCSHDELMEAIWDADHETHTREELHRLILEVRRKVEANPADPKLLELARGLGYRLHSCAQGASQV